MKALSNLSRKQVIEVDPFTLAADELPADQSKPLHAKWQADPATEWVFLSGFEGVGADQRIDALNPAARQLALIADYDQNISKAEVEAMLTGRSVRLKPTLIHPTASRGVRLIWLFAEPVAVAPELIDEWLRLLADKLNLKRLLPGLDPCWESSTQYYEWRPDWTELRGAPLAADWLAGLRLQLAEKGRVAGADVELPMETVAAEVEKRWPGRWKGEFKLGARGMRFWDDSAANDTAAIVRETGMTCFTGDQAFVTWSQIFGRSFVEEFQTSKLGAASQDIYFVGGGYLFREAGEWHELRIEAARRRLALRGLKLSPEKGEELSEADKVISAVEKQNYLHGAAPIVFRREKVVRLEDGRRVLNSATAALMPPGNPDGPWPHLREFFEGLFYSEVQLKVWHAWMQRFARRAWEQNSKLLGHSLILLGDPGDGKTFLATDVLGAIFGGVADPAIMLEGTTHFNANLFEKGLWTNSDGLTVQRQEDRDRYTSLLKAYSANEKHSVHSKGLKSLDDIPWGGRILITGNLNTNSMGLVPDETEAADDKFIVLRSHARRNKTLLHKHIGEEGPAYLAWLLERHRSDLEPDFRFGFKAWHNPDIMARARAITSTGSTIEALEAFGSSGIEVVGELTDATATEILTKLKAAGVALDPRMGTRRLGFDLARIKETQPGLVKSRILDGLTRWTVDLKKLTGKGAS